MAAGGGIDPIHQFHINPIVELKPFGLNLSFTNTSLWMVIVTAVVSAIMIYGSSQRSVVPGRLQSLAEMMYEFVASTLTGVMNKDGMKFFPFVFSLFMFVLASNLLGLLPGSFTVTSQIIVTAALAVLVMSVVLIYGIAKHGTHFFGLFVPSGVPGWLLPFVVLIEVVSFVSRPVSLSLRLFGNMLAGHIALKVFGGFVVALTTGAAAGLFTYAIAPLPLLLAVALTALEVLVAVLQAYVFAILTCVYLNDALHPGH
ncbi:F-type H+-transporting ATPase subunit a [Bosea sp. OAE752]|jgi:F-type H+-transporting ATPase subunit a|uniref:F0F1 ATP synthase subunit A n=1 Tax=unclassified Bosea (in: a-proteobacteria) TaxID=2653178 RepID=UPI00056F71C7|nr:F0F1 ATP synthase subunit A [Bosea sp. UNC402CLCol]